MSYQKLSLREEVVEKVLNSYTDKISNLLSVRVNQVIIVVCKMVKVVEVTSVKEGESDGYKGCRNKRLQ